MLPPIANPARSRSYKGPLVLPIANLSTLRCIESEAVSGLTLASDSNCSGSNIVITLSENKVKKLLYTPATDTLSERYTGVLKPVNHARCNNWNCKLMLVLQKRIR